MRNSVPSPQCLSFNSVLTTQNTGLASIPSAQPLTIESSVWFSQEVIILFSGIADYCSYWLLEIPVPVPKLHVNFRVSNHILSQLPFSLMQRHTSHCQHKHKCSQSKIMWRCYPLIKFKNTLYLALAWYTIWSVQPWPLFPHTHPLSLPLLAGFTFIWPSLLMPLRLDLYKWSAICFRSY